MTIKNPLAADASRGGSQAGNRRRTPWLPRARETTGQVALDACSAAEIAQLLCGLGQVLDALAIGTFAVDAAARIAFRNDSAERLLRHRVAVTLRNGRLCSAEPGQAAELDRLIRQAASGEGETAGPRSAALALRRLDEPPLLLVITSLRAELASVPGPPRLALLFVTDPHHRAAAPEPILARLYGLTSGEARLMSALSAGMRLTDYAARHGVTLNTAKTQLKQVFAKTGCSRQAELVAAIAANPLLRMTGQREI